MILTQPHIKAKKRFVTSVVANEAGGIFELQGYTAVGMTGGSFIPLTIEQTSPIPYGTELMFLPNRKPVVFNIEKNRIETLTHNPYEPKAKIFPVAAFNSPGYITLHLSAYEEEKQAPPLPLFSYGAAGWHNNHFVSSIIMIDREIRQDLRCMPIEKVIAGVKNIRKKMPQNRLRKHLEKCALTYGCPAGKNFFLKRYEAPLPTSQTCNAKCLGCISLQPDKIIPNCQERIKFTPTPDEIAQIALEHIQNVPKSIVSFGQGCEGEPLTAANIIEPAIKIIRAKTSKGTINLNTNASKPNILKKLFDAGLDSIRVSINSVREKCYNAYFRPTNYKFQNVIESIELAASNNIFVSINYLNCPGFTDSIQEAQAFNNFLNKRQINRIQWRNLNYDPVKYLIEMNRVEQSESPIGMLNHVKQIAESHPNVQFGYFNPPKEDFQKKNQFLTMIK